MHFEYTLRTQTEEDKQMLIALLTNVGFSGFLETEGDLKAYIPAHDFDRQAVEEVLAAIPAECTIREVAEQNWNAEWESSFEPIAVFDEDGNTPLARIRAGFHQHDPVFPHDLLITPKMSFGTGHHPTTYLMVQQMTKLDFAGKTVVDFGTGTGVLAILAEKMGAASVTAIDCDDWSITNTEENAAANHCSRIKILKGETIISLQADILLANINTNIIIANIPAIVAACGTHTKILLSGVMTHDRERLVAALQTGGLSVSKVSERANWLAFLCTPL